MMQHGVVPAASRAVRIRARSRRAWTPLLLGGLCSVAGCYATRPVTSAPAAGSTVILELNDRARVQFGERIGPSAARIEGIVQASSDTAYMLRISSVTYLNGGSNRWSGEPFTVPYNLITSANVREFSRGKTTAVGVGIVAAIAAVFIKTKLFGSSGPEQQPLPIPGGSS